MVYTQFDFHTSVILESKLQPVIVMFASPGCGPCKWMEKALVEVVKEMKGKVHLVSIPISDCPECIEKYEIKSNPTTIFFSKGEPKLRLKGAFPKMVVEQWINDQL